MIGKYARVLVFAVILLLAAASRGASPPEPGVHDIGFSAWAGPNLDVRVFLPEGFDADTPIVIVMHGASRDLPRYFADWRKQAEILDFIVVVPEFSAADFPGSARYNLGNVFDRRTGRQRPEEAWTFSAIEPLFDHVVAWTGSARTSYALFGHSAGSQFVHRFLYFKPGARADRVVLANAGWYTVPDFGVDFPYGLEGSGIKPDVLRSFFARDITVLLGGADTDRSDDNLRKSSEADLQGPHRLARGEAFFRAAKAKAAEMEVQFNWDIRIVPGAGHSNAQMAPAAAALLTAIREDT